MAGDSKKLQPLVKWAQRRDKIILTIHLEDCKDPKIDLKTDKLIFSGKGGPENKEYEATIEFFEAIEPNDSKYGGSARTIPMSIKKKEDSYWPRLLKDKTKVHWLKTDFDKWKDEDDSDVDEAEDNKFEDMMQQMGNFNAQDPMMPPPGEEEEDDSDDEELPDLET